VLMIKTEEPAMPVTAAPETAGPASAPLIPAPYHYLDIAFKNVVISGIKDLLNIHFPLLIPKLNLEKKISFKINKVSLINDPKLDEKQHLPVIVVTIDRIDNKNPLMLMIEFQNNKYDLFSKRFYEKITRLQDMHPENFIEAMAIFSGKALNENFYTESLGYSEYTFKFNSIHLPTCNPYDLENDPRPFFRIYQAASSFPATTVKEAEDKAGLVFRTMRKYAFNADGKEIYTQYQRNYICFFIKLIFNLNNNMDKLSAPFKSEFKEELEFVPTEEYIQNTREQIGKMKGEFKGEMKAVLKMLKSGFSVDEVANIIEVDKKRLIEAADDARTKLEPK
jgi:hypothetical protein